MIKIQAFELKHRPKNQWAYWVNECALLVNRPYLQMAARLKDLPADFIRDIYLESKSWTKNPPALFWKLLKENNSVVAIKTL